MNQKEQELRNENKSVEDFLTQLNARIKILIGEQEVISSKLNDKKLDLSVKQKLLTSRKKTLEINHEKIIELTVIKNQQSISVKNVYIKSLKTEMDLRQLQWKICKEKLAAYTEDSLISPSSLSFSADEEKSRETSAELSRLWTEMKCANEDLSAVMTQLNELTKQSSEILRSVNDLEICKKKSEVLYNKAEKDLMIVAEKLKQLDVQKKQLMLRSNQLQKTLVKISCCRQLKALECRDNEIQGVAEDVVNLRSIDNVRNAKTFDLTSNISPFS